MESGDPVSDYLVLVPFYSNLAYLRETLMSVVAQTDAHWRAVVVDDSPVDPGVRELVAAIADERIEIVRNERNLGVAGSFNRCFDIAHELGADLAMILHADDLLAPGFIATVRGAHERWPDAACVATRASIIGADGRPRRTLPDTVKRGMWPRRVDRLEGEQGLRRLLRGQFFYCPGVSYDVGKLAHPAWNERWTQVMDLELYARVLLDGGAIQLLDEPLFVYRRHEGSMTQVNSATLVRTEEETALSRELAEEARRRGWRSAGRAGTARVAVRLQSMLRAGALVMRARPRSAWRALRLALSR
ncbi:MAG: glycosyltransferase family 2 protein [Ilumatobacteraceae bacterium]